MSESTAKNRYEEAIRQGNRKLLQGNSFSSWRTLSRRRTLVAGVAAGIGLYVLGVPIEKPWVTLAGLVLFLGSWLLIRIVTRGMADLPANALDERQVSVRNSTYLEAYRLIGGLIAIISIGCIVFLLTGHKQVNTDTVLQMMVAALFCAMAVPSCLVAWTEREI